MGYQYFTPLDFQLGSYTTSRYITYYLVTSYNYHIFIKTYASINLSTTWVYWVSPWIPCGIMPHHLVIILFLLQIHHKEYFHAFSTLKDMDIVWVMFESRNPPILSMHASTLTKSISFHTSTNLKNFNVAPIHMSLIICGVKYRINWNTLFLGCERSIYNNEGEINILCITLPRLSLFRE